MIELTIAAIFIPSSCKGNKLPIASHGGIQLIAEFLDQDYAGGIGVQARLDSHTTQPLDQPSDYSVSVSLGVVFSLLQIIHGLEKSSQLVEKAIALLDDIVSSSKTALKETAGTCHTIWGLVETIEEESMKCKEHAASIFLPICQSRREKYRGLILREEQCPDCFS
ncbi:hypothetical protein D8674_036304 [Pyrus ussuriensis x Pyrus communis]|uniref:Uncharacterized protein n=1 Tax=Pyrus ussuriensis x Pyrus communis TaxID=2448454 RepID=A0A5N5GFA0_9ROSA|nr:hypothetical protein D8674_036304 [Pyrus ussuriensis x Pyrus communis]